MHKVIVKGILSSQNGMNIYRGCSHGCIYCDSRSSCYQINHSFEDIEVKSNALELLEKKLAGKRKKVMVGTGSMSDPYIHLEEELCYTRKALEIIYKYGHGVTLHTKSNRVLRDLDLLKKISEKTKCVIQVSLSTADLDLCSKIEPNVSNTIERFEVLKTLRDNGIPTVVWLCPFLPFINDTEDNISKLMDYCIEARVWGIIYFGVGLTLREGNREYFYNKLDEHFPGLKEKYISLYGNSYSVNSPNNYNLTKIITKRCKDNNIIIDPNLCFNYLNTFEEKPPIKEAFLPGFF